MVLIISQSRLQIIYQALANDHYKKQKKIELDAQYINAMKLFTLNHELVHSSEENIKKSEYY